MSSTTTTDAPTQNVANQKKVRPFWMYTDTNVFIRTQFPGHRPRYIPLSSINSSSGLFQACADFWPEYFSASARYAFSLRDPQTTKGLIGIAFYEPEIKNLVEIRYHDDRDFSQLQVVTAMNITTRVMEMAENHRISLSGPFFVDLELVREGRETLRVAGYACTRDLRERVIGMDEKRELEIAIDRAKRRRREVGDEAENDEEPTQRRRLWGGYV